MDRFVKGTDRKISGVCSGFAEYFDIDVTLVRLLYLMFTIVSGVWVGVLFYLIASLIIPEK